MKKKRRMAGMAALMMAFTLTACSSTSENEAPPAAKATEAAAAVSTEAATVKAQETEAQATQAETNTAQTEAATSENKASDFTATLTDGSEFTLSDAAGKPVLINFWATWCGPCVGEMPAFEKLYEEYGDTVQILAINCMEDTAAVDAFVKQNGYSFPVAYDVDGSIERLYPTDGIPYTIVIDAQGNVAQTFLGSRGADYQYQEYKKALDQVLGK